ncbi:MAG: coiled-coil domain-containing protein [Promethearchaeota archaeon]
MESLLFIVELKELKVRKEALKTEFDIAKKYKDSSDFLAISDLLEKVNNSLEQNKKKAAYLEEDYFQQKNQINLIKKDINNYELEIENLNSQLKMCFAQINQITRHTQNGSESGKDEVLKSLGINTSIRNSEKIRMLQLKAKEISYNIKQAKSKKGELIEKLNELFPKYEIYKDDYEKLLSIIKRDEKKANEIQSELKQKIKSEEGNLIEAEIPNVNLLRTLNQIDEDIKKVDKELNEMIQSEELIDIKKEQDLSIIKKKLELFSSEVSKKIKNLRIDEKMEIFIESLKNYRKFEVNLDELQRLLNFFLLKINLFIQFQILINNKNSNLFVSTFFKRKDKDKITFSELTTPEKVFFIVSLYLSFCLILEKDYIIFSNLFIPNDYNKGGSILRAIRKILPVFKNNDNLKKYNLVLIISNIEIKKEIKNIKTFEIKES